MVAFVAIADASSVNAEAQADHLPALNFVQPPDWVRRPTGEQVAGVYPERAMRLGMPGLALLACEVNEKIPWGADSDRF